MEEVKLFVNETCRLLCFLPQGPVDHSDNLHQASQSMEHDIVPICPSPVGDVPSSCHNLPNPSPKSGSCVDAVTDESSRAVPSGDTRKESVSRNAGKMRLRSLPAPQQKRTRFGTEKVGEKSGTAMSQITMTSGKVSPRYRPPTLLQRRESAMLKKAGSVTDVKNSKNKMNEKKATVSAVKTLINTQKPPEALKRKSNIARKLDLSSRKTPPKMQMDGNDVSSTHKRSIPKSKWGNITSRIESGRDHQKAKPKEEVKAGPTKSETPPAGSTTSHSRRLFPKTPGGDVMKHKLSLTSHMATLSNRKSSSPEPSSRSSRSSVDSDRVTSGDSGVRTLRSGVKGRPPSVGEYRPQLLTKIIHTYVQACGVK